MAEFLLIHGTGHGAWCWEALIPELQALGHGARAIDLPGACGDPTPLAEVTLELYAEAVLRAARPGPVILVGHSAGGFPITLAAERDPAPIARLVYLCAYVPEPGKGLVQMRSEAERQPLLGAIQPNDDGMSISFDPDKAVAHLYQDCPPDVAAAAVARLCPQPVAPQRTGITPGANYASVPRSYILCTKDNAIDPGHQAAMASGFPPEDIHEMAVSHSPFLSRPAALAAVLDRIARGQPSA